MRAGTCDGRWLSAVMAAALLVACAGCEDSSHDSESLPSISPASVKISAAESHGLVFKVKGGTPAYAWTVANPALGTVVSAGDTAIYTSALAPGQNFVTVTDLRSNAVTATITQL